MRKLLTISFIFICFEVFTQGGNAPNFKKRGTIKVRKKSSRNITIKEPISRNINQKQPFKNPMAGQWKFVKATKEGKPHKIEDHVIVFYDSTYNFRKIYSNSSHQIYQGQFPVNRVINILNQGKDTVKIKEMTIRRYNLFMENDEPALTELTEIEFLDFYYDGTNLSFTVLEDKSGGNRLRKGESPKSTFYYKRS